MQTSPQSPSFDEIAAFIAVAAEGSFIGAARRLELDPSLLSRRVQRLEERLGIRLFARTTRKVGLTETGERYLARVGDLMAQLEAAGAEAAEMSAAPRGVLRLSLPLSFGQRVVAPMLAGFVQRYPGIRLDLGFSNRRVDLVAEGFDLAIRMGAPRDSSLTMRKLASYDEILVAAPAYLEARGHPASPDDLADHACLGFTGNAFWPRWHLTRGDTVERVDPRGPIQSDNSDALLEAAADGAGIMLTPDWLAAAAIEAGRLLRVLPDWRGATEGTIHALLPPGRLVPAKTRLFLDELGAML